VEPGATTGEMTGIPEDRPCQALTQCDEAGEPGFAYICEKPGPLGTTSIGDGRVRYRGILQDPNELAMAIGLTFPLGLTLWTRRRSLVSSLLVAALLVFGGTCIVLTASRTGQMVVMAVAAAYFAVRFKWKGIALGGVLAMPALVLGGRSSGEASASTQERLEAWSAGMRFLRGSPVWGIGQDQFREHHYITAHNSFVLAAAELGVVGLVLFLGLYYLSFKIVLSGMRHSHEVPEAHIAYLWGRGLLATLCGMATGSFFLSLTYHPVVWLVFGLVAAYALALRRHDQTWKLAFGWPDVRTIAILAVGFLGGLQIYTKVKGL
jgi:O-antigen ligase